MVSFYGDYDTAETVVIPFNAFTSDDPSASVTVTDLISTDVEIYKDGSLTERSSATHSGIAVDIDVDGVVGAHWVTIDLSDNDDDGFYVAGSRYQVMVVGTTIDGATVNAWIGAFSIGCTLRPTTAGRKATVSANGEMNADLTYIHGSALTETAGQLAGRFVNFFDQASATFSVATALSSFKATGFSVAGDLMLADVTKIHGSALTETSGGYLAAAFVKLFDVVTPLLVSSVAAVTPDGSGLTGIPWNASWDTEVQSECDDALVAYKSAKRTDIMRGG